MTTYEFIAPTSYDVIILKRWIQDEDVMFLELKLWENPLFCSGSFMCSLEPGELMTMHNKAVKAKMLDSFHMIREEVPDELERMTLMN
jgi:hypothetical protein